MIKKIAWDAFKNTGDINTFLEYKQIENIQKNIEEIEQLSDKGEEREKVNKLSNEEININKNKVD